MKRCLISIILALALVLTSFGGFYAVAEDEEPLHIRIYCMSPANGPGYMPAEDSYVKNLLEEKFNVKFEVLPLDWQNNEASNVAISSGLYPDVIMSKGVADYAKLGVLRPIDKEMIKTYAPRIYSDIDTIDPSGEAWRKATYEGILYGVPEVTILRTAGYAMGMRTDWMKAVGYDEAPETLDEFEDMMIKIHTEDPDGNGIDDTYGLDWFDGFFYAEAYFDVQRDYWKEQDGELTYGAVSEGYKKALEMLHRWYELEIIDPDFVTDGRQQVIEKFSNNKLAAYEAFATWIRTDSASPVAKLLENNPDAEWGLLPPPVREDGKRAGKGWSTATGSSMCFGINASDEVVQRMLEMQNEIFSDADLFCECTYGKRGVDWEYNEDGTVNKLYDTSNQDYMVSVGMRAYEMGLNQNEVSLWKYLTAPYLSSWNWTRENVYGVQADYAPTFSAEAQAYGNDLNSIVTEYYHAVITGTKDLDSTWDEYVQSWYNAGGDVQTAEAREQYEAIK